MGSVMDECVFADITGNCHFTQEKCGENERLDNPNKEGKRIETLHSMHNTFKNNRKKDLHIKELHTSSTSGSTSQQQVEVYTPLNQLDHNSKDKGTETVNINSSYKGEGSKKKNVTSIVENKNTSKNGYLKSDEDSMSIQLIAVNLKQHKNEARLSGKSISSDEYYDCVSLPCQSISSEMHTSKYRSDSSDRKGDGENSPVIRANRNVSKNSSKVHHSSRSGSVSEREHAKKKISFRALVRMKGLGRKLRRKTKHKQINNKPEAQARDSLLFSDSSAKYLLETSTSATEESKTINSTSEGETQQHKNKVKSYSFSGTSTPDDIFNSDGESSSDIACGTDYLDERRHALCEEIEKTIICGEQSLAELRSILVIQHKLTGFGLL